jgi:hypothetical protein
MHRLLDHRSRAPQSMLPDPKAPDMPFHPLAQLFPLPSEDELRGMADDIAARGLREPIVTLEGQILDGRCRYLACKMAAVEPTFEGYGGDDPVAYIYSRNVARRHLTKSQRAILAARLADLPVGANQYSAGLPIGRAAQQLNVSERSVARAREIVRRGIPELVQVVESGEVSLFAGEQISGLPQQEQQNALKYGGAGSTLALPENGFTPSQTSLVTSPAKTNDRPTQGDETATPTKRFPGWLWGDFIPLSGVTVIVGGAATMPVAIKIAETVGHGGDWPDYSRASCGGIIWMSAVKDFVEQLRHQIAPAVPSFGVHLMPPELDHFGLPIRHFACDLYRLRSRIAETPGGVVLVTLDTLSDYVRCGDVEQAIKGLHGAIEALSAFAIEHTVAVVLPCELPTRDRTAITRVVNRFKEFSEITTIFAAAQESAQNSGRLVVAKRPTEAGTCEFPFHVRRRNSMPTPVWDAAHRDDELLAF